MRALLLLWFAPMLFFWGWYGLSSSGMDFGLHILSREVHDTLFGIYGSLLNVPASSVPGMAAWACFADSLIVLGIAAFRWRKNWFPQVKTVFLAYWYGSDEIENNHDAEQLVTDEEIANGPMHPAE